jgi:hypothetical protein
MNRLELNAKLASRAMQDETFRQKLLNDPRAAVEEVLGKKLPANMEVKTIEESPSTLTVIVPAKPTDELSDNDLEKVAGGAHRSGSNIQTVPKGGSGGNGNGNQEPPWEWWDIEDLG